MPANPVLRSQDECVVVVMRRLYELPARLRSRWKRAWEHLYVG